MKPKVIVIVGPTASGKTSLGIVVAKKLNGEIISCDSMQIYKEMNIGTAKPTDEERSEIEHHMIDFVFPNERYTVSDFKKDAEIEIEKILKRNKTPIIVGGTGLYVDSLIYGINYPEIDTDENYRKELENIVIKDGLDKLYKMACNIDAEAMEKISPNDKKRILRVLEIYHDTGKTKTELEIISREKEIPYDYKVFAIDMPREILYKRIESRVDQMIENGLIEEVNNLLKKYNDFPTAMQGIGYKEIKEYLDGHLTKEEAIEKIKKESRHYAKRQLTWFRKNKNIVWLDGTKENEYNAKIMKDSL